MQGYPHAPDLKALAAKPTELEPAASTAMADRVCKPHEIFRTRARHATEKCGPNAWLTQ